MQSFNIIEGLEEQSYSWTKVAPRKMSGTTTGETETLNFTGSTLAMKSLAEHFLAEGSATMQVSCTVTRQEADMARLAVTRTYYGGADEPDEPVDPEEPEGEAAGEAGSSESNPLISFEFTEVQLPILTHPLVQEKGPGDNVPHWAALRMLSQGADEWQPVVWNYGDQQQVYTVGELIGALDPGMVNLVRKQQFYLDVMITASVRYEIDGRSTVPNFGQVPRIEAPPKAIQLTGGRNWLFCGGGVTLEGGRVMVTKVYKSSDAGGWNPECYSGK